MPTSSTSDAVLLAVQRLDAAGRAGHRARRGPRVAGLERQSQDPRRRVVRQLGARRRYPARPRRAASPRESGDREHAEQVRARRQRHRVRRAREVALPPRAVGRREGDRVVLVARQRAGRGPTCASRLRSRCRRCSRSRSLSMRKIALRPGEQRHLAARDVAVVVRRARRAEPSPPPRRRSAGCRRRRRPPARTSHPPAEVGRTVAGRARTRSAASAAAVHANISAMLHVQQERGTARRHGRHATTGVR